MISVNNRTITTKNNLCMETIQLNIDKALGSVTKEQVFAYEKEVAESMEKLHKGTG